MRQLTSLLIIATLALFSSAATAPAQVRVGDRPTFEFPILNSEERITHLDVRGKWLTVLFWSSNDAAALQMLTPAGMMAAMLGLSAEQAQTMMDQVAGLADADALQAIQADQEILAVCVDEPRRQRNVQRAIQRVSFTGKIVYDDQGTGRQIAQAWGVSRVPTLAILAPNGELVWIWQVGQPLDVAALARLGQMAERFTPLTPGERDQAERQLEDAWAALTAGDEQGALRALEGFPTQAADYFEELGRRYRELAGQLNPLGASELQRVRRMVERGNTEAAKAELVKLSNLYAALPVGRTMRDEIKRLSHPPDLARRQAAQQQQARVAAMIARAEQLLASGRRVDAHRKLTFIVDRFPHTQATARARTVLEQLTNDPGFQREQRAERTRRVSERLFAEADELLAQGDVTGARGRWRQIVEQFPDSDFAKTAQEKLDAHR